MIKVVSSRNIVGCDTSVGHILRVDVIHKEMQHGFVYRLG